MTRHKYIITLIVETSEKVTKKALKEAIELAAMARLGSLEPYITKTRVRAVDID